MNKYILEIDEEYVNKCQQELDYFVKPVEEVIRNAMDFYLLNSPTEKKYIRIKKFKPEKYKDNLKTL